MASLKSGHTHSKMVPTYPGRPHCRTGSSLSLSQATGWARCKLPGSPEYCNNFESYSVKGDIVALSDQLFPIGEHSTISTSGYNPIAKHSVDHFTDKGVEEFKT